MTLVGRRRRAISLQVELIEEARSAEWILRAAAPAVARARQVFGLRQRIGNVELQSALGNGFVE